ncbi:MAG: helicase-related protein [Spirochaetes bacterium]|nr:helicase-related protein [Spirochaetota bacterium]
MSGDIRSSLDLTFITNEDGKTLKNRFEQIIKGSRFFDCLVGYFYTSGFYYIQNALENTEKIRILVGIQTNKDVFDLLSHAETKDEFENSVVSEMVESEDNFNVEEGVIKFIEWIKSGKLQIRAYPSKNIHAKLYIITFAEGDRDIGRVITGSSNFTKSGLIDNLEFNVELKNRSDYEFAKSKFEELWKESVDVSETYVETIEKRTWLNQNITPYQLYLKFLYEYFKDQLNISEELYLKFVPQNFKKFKYQEQAVLNAKKIIDQYGGCFISDVVGLGKTYMGALLASQLDGRTIVIAPPALLKKSNPGSWPNVFADFGIYADYVSIGKLEDAKELLENREYSNIIIDESHHFRNENTNRYEDITEICRGKRVILVSATPYNNSPIDIFNQIKLFQPPRNSNIPGIPNIEDFFKGMNNRLKKYNRSKDYDKYLEVVKNNAYEIREKILKYIMVRRTRGEIEKYFAEDLKKNNIGFPEVEKPIPIFYQLNYEEDKIFMNTVKLITQDFKYSRYTPLIYLNKHIDVLLEQSQINMGGFMKILLVKRLESSFYAFRKSIDRFINSYKMFIKAYENGYVFISQKYLDDIYQYLEEGNDEEIQKLIDDEKAERYDAKDFREDFLTDLKHDLEILETIKSMWETVKRDPKLDTFIKNLKNNELLKKNKLVLFTESKETAEYLTKNINSTFGEIALMFHGESSEEVRDKVIENFDARAKNKKDDYRILISTDVLSEGVNLHRSNVIINYDIPWNPTRIMQRIGRINRIDTPFDKIFTFNFFPTTQADSEIELTYIARSKIESFLTLLGGDSAILTEGEPVSSHELFDKIMSTQDTNETEEIENSEIKYLKIIEEIRDKNPELFNQIKLLPKKARSAKKANDKIKDVIHSDTLVTFFRKGKLMKFFLTNDKETVELDFVNTAKILESSYNETREKIPLQNYYEFLDKNKTAFFNSTVDEIVELKAKRRSGNEKELLKIVKAYLSNNKKLTEEQENYLKKVIKALEEGILPKKTIDRAYNSVNKISYEDLINSLKIVNILQKEISLKLLESDYNKNNDVSNEKREVILSLFVHK